jgi:putative ABC transport system permease protein
MILGEAAVISMVGGVIGLMFASLLTALIRKGPAFMAAMRTLSITPDVAAISLVLAVVIGVGSSLIPAWNAARTSILESLRNAG